MARKDALLRLHQRLTAKRDSLRKKLIDEHDLHRRAQTPGGDVGDAANRGTESEMNSQLEALESRELNQVERAIELIREGRYGLCEVCSDKIPITRLNALPFSLHCVDCQRKREESGVTDEDVDVDWESAYEFEGRLNDREYTLGEIERNG